MNPASGVWLWVSLLAPMVVLIGAVIVYRRVAMQLSWRASFPPRLVLVAVVFVLSVGMVYFRRPPQAPPAMPGQEPSMLPLIWPSVAVLAFLAFVASAFWRNSDRAVSAANRKANAGDVDGAIADLRAILAMEPPTFLRLNMLGNYLIGRDRHAEALAAFDEALELVRAQVTGPKVDHFTFCVLQNNRGASLYQLDRFEEGLEAYAAAQVSLDQVRADTKSVVGSDVTVDYLILDGRSRCLARLGRVDEATEAFRAAEALFPKVIGRYGAEQKAMFRKNFEGTKALVKPESAGLGDDFA